MKRLREETHSISNADRLIFDDEPGAKIDSIGIFGTFVTRLNKRRYHDLMIDTNH